MSGTLGIVTSEVIEAVLRASYVRICFGAFTVVSFAAALPILAIVLGDAAWNGLNVAMYVLLGLTVGGVACHIFGFVAVLWPKRFLLWVTAIGASTVAVVALILSCGFLLHRTREIPINRPISVVGFQAPLLAFYAAALFCCGAEAAFASRQLSRAPFHRRRTLP